MDMAGARHHRHVKKKIYHWYSNQVKVQSNPRQRDLGTLLLGGNVQKKRWQSQKIDVGTICLAKSNVWRGDKSLRISFLTILFAGKVINES